MVVTPMSLMTAAATKRLKMKTINSDGKTIEINDVDGDDSHVLFTFDEATSTTCFNSSVMKCESNAASTGAPSNAGLYFRWTPESIKLMLTLRFEKDREFAQRLRQKKDLWNEIAAEMARVAGYVITGEICDLKFRNMLQTYKKNRLKEERGLQELIIWEYYSMFKEAALRSNENGGDQLIPSMLCESVCTEDTCNESLLMQKMEQKPETTQSGEKEETTNLPNKRACNGRRRRKRRMSSNSLSDNSSDYLELLPPEKNSTVVEKKFSSLRQQERQQQQLQQQQLQQQQQEHQQHQNHQLNFPQSASSQHNLSSGPQSRHSLPPPMMPSQDTSANATESKAFTARLVPPPRPVWLSPSELSECEVFGQSVGLQLANVHDSYSRSLLKLKIQELFFLAGTGKLPDKYGSSNS